MSGGTAPTGPAAAGPARFVRRPGPRIEERELPPARYSYGGDEFIFVELSEEMSFRANFKARAILKLLEDRSVPGIVDLCPNSTSYLIRFDPDELKPDVLLRELKSIEAGLGDLADFPFPARVV